MTAFKTTRAVEWGDCDSAGIVYYPNYYRWMDGVFHEFTAMRGFSQRSLSEDYGLIGTPLIDTGCRFHAPASHGDRLEVEASLAKLGETSLRMDYTFICGQRVAAKGFEARVFARRGADGIEKAPIPAAVRAMLAV